MKKHLLLAAAALTLTFPAFAQDAEPEGAPSPNQIVDQAPESDWVEIPATDLLVMRLADDAEGEWRIVTIQLMPAPFSQGWVENIRTLARAHWFDDISINRVQDNYVVQWGDPNGEDEAKAKPLPEGLKVMDEEDYTVQVAEPLLEESMFQDGGGPLDRPVTTDSPLKDQYVAAVRFDEGWPIGVENKRAAPLHCYGMVGVGRNYSPDTGSGAELYTVIGHAPRHLDRNIALVGRIIEGMEHLSSLPRGKGDLGFYEDKSKRTPILSVRLASDLPEDEQPHFEYLSTDSEAFARYADARANRRDPFFIHPAGGADICNIPVPVRPTPNG